MSYARQLARGARLGGQPRPRALGARHRRRPLERSGPRRASPASCSTPALPARARASRARAPGRTRCSASTSTCARSRATAACKRCATHARRAAARPVPAHRAARLAVVRDRLTYCNARLPQALIASAELDRATRRCATPACESLEWLVDDPDARRTATSRRSARTASTRAAARRPRFDQQPVEACAMVSACLDARRVTGDARWLAARAARVRLVPRAEPAAAAALRPGDRRLPRRPARRPRQREPGRRVDALVPARAGRDALDRSHRTRSQRTERSRRSTS